MTILNLAEAPSETLQRAAWLSGVHEAVQRELEQEYASVYFDARLGGFLQQAVNLGPHSMRQALALTRAENNRRNRMVRWADGLDRTSSAFSG